MKRRSLPNLSHSRNSVKPFLKTHELIIRDKQFIHCKTVYICFNGVFFQAGKRFDDGRALIYDGTIISDFLRPLQHILGHKIKKYPENGGATEYDRKIYDKLALERIKRPHVSIVSNSTQLLGKLTCG